MNKIELANMNKEVQLANMNNVELANMNNVELANMNNVELANINNVELFFLFPTVMNNLVASSLLNNETMLKQG